MSAAPDIDGEQPTGAGEPANDNARDEARRRRQRDENARIQDDVASIMPPIMSVEEMLAECVWIANGSQVGRLSVPRSVLSFGEFRDLTAASWTKIGDPESKARARKFLHADLWKGEKTRMTVMDRTFHAGAAEICCDPEGQPALNSWRPIERWPTATNVEPFLQHVAYLIEDAGECGVFLDWLAHIEQCPGVLPHYGWLHIAANTGTGRNWLASVLARVWRGYVAPNVDLPALLESQFNDALSGRILALVDEVQEGGGENPYRHANKLKSLVNAEERSINPKCKRPHREHNACRWLVFSNHAAALPLNGTDRRWRVVYHKADPRPPEDYTKLYALLTDAEFINAVGVYLSKRDISGFKPGERPPLNDAKLAALSASKSQISQAVEQLVAHWPADVIPNAVAALVLGDGADRGFTPAMRRAMSEAAAIQYGDGRVVKVQGTSTKCWLLRNVEKWADAKPHEIATEISKAPMCPDAQSALEVLAARATDYDYRPF